jgi:DNA-binding GntR family transcriptional regulator
VESKTSVIYEQLKKDICSIKYRSDELINEKDIAKQYDTSKTPVREALAMLVQEGYLKKIPRVGYFINELSEQEYEKLVYLRYTLERGIVTYILDNCSDEEIDSVMKYCMDKDVSYKEYAGINIRFHIELAKLTKNEYLVSSLQNTFERLIRVPSHKIYEATYKSPHAGHIKLLDTIKKRDKDLALKLVRDECRRDDDKPMKF